MYKQTKPQSQAFRFRRFCRAGWAAYNSMHREVTIGRLEARVADRSLSKAVAAAAMGLMLSTAATATAQSERESEVRTLPAVEVILAADSLQASAEPVVVLSASQFNQSSVATIADLVGMLPSLDLRARGVDDVQTDLAMRGGTFDQMVVLLNGINLTDAQTGHHTMDIPIDLRMVERIELLTAADLMARGVVGFCGGVNIVVSDQPRTTQPDALHHLHAEVAAGSHGTIHATAQWQASKDKWDYTAAAAYHRSDGYRANTDYHYGSLYLQASRHGLRNDLRIAMGMQFKDFGGAGFYSTTYPDQFEATRTLVLSATDVYRFDHGLTLHTSAYGRLHTDRFELFRHDYASAPSWYGDHNHHLSDLAGMRTVLKWRGVSVGAEVRHEGILSNVLGDSLGATHWLYSETRPLGYARTNASLFAGYSGRWRKLMWQASAMGLHNTQFGLHYAWGINLQYQPSQHLTMLADASRTYRLPSFTDLYYKSVNQMADRNLNAEHSLNAEVGLRVRYPQWQAQATVYHRQGRQIIDWMRRPTEDVWYSMNHAEVDATGIDLMATYHLAMGRTTADITATYAYCYIDQKADGWISGSALDYVRHKGGLHGTLQLPCRIHVAADGTYRFREGQYVDAQGRPQDYGGVFLLNATIDYPLPYTFLSTPTTLFLSGYNLLDRTWRDHGGVPQPGITFMGGIRLNM